MRTIDRVNDELASPRVMGQLKWKRLALLTVIGYEAAGCLFGGSILITEPEGNP